MILTGGTPAAKTLKNVTRTIPIVMAIVGDPVASGLVESRPLRALAAVVAAQPALLYGYSQWGGVKELGTAATYPGSVYPRTASSRLS